MHYEAAESVEFESVCIYRHCMDYSSSYSYTLEKNENDWYFSFDAVIDSSGVHTEVEKQRIDEHLSLIHIYKEEIDGNECLIFALGTNNEDSFVQEILYGVSKTQIYVYDVCLLYTSYT